MALKDIVDVQITRQTAALTRVGFGTLAFVYDRTTAATARVLSFGDADEVADSTDLTPEAKAALTAAFTGDLRPDRVKAIYRLSGQVNPADDEEYIEALTAASNYDDDWYCLTIQSRNPSRVLEVAEWIEARNKIFVTASANVDILDPAEDGDIASQLLSMSYSRTAVIYSASALTRWPDTAWAGPLLPNDPGSITWAFKTISGVPGELFTGAQITALEAKRVTRIETIQGLSRTIGGYTSDPGAFVDVIRGIDWLRQRMAEDIFLKLVNSPKIPYTNAGIAIIENAVRARLGDAINRNVIVDDENLTVTTPDALSVDQNDRANRILRDVKFTARMAGAIHKVIVRGTATV